MLLVRSLCYGGASRVVLVMLLVLVGVFLGTAILVLRGERRGKFFLAQLRHCQLGSCRFPLAF